MSIGREYWVTAAHILTGAKGKPYGRVGTSTVQLDLLNPGGAGREWIPERFTVLQPDADVDIVALVATHLILTNINSGTPAPIPSSAGLTIGGPCEFLGYALEGGWRAKLPDGNYWMPFVKHYTVSGSDSDLSMWILDGINNPGFSGGPVILGTADNTKFAAVVSGYYLEPTEVIRGNAAQLAPDAPKDYAIVNSGFIIAYDIRYAADLIKRNPTGPLRPPK